MKDFLPNSFAEFTLGTSVWSLILLAFYLSFNGFVYQRWELTTKLEACNKVQDTQRKERCILVVIEE